MFFHYFYLTISTRALLKRCYRCVVKSDLLGKDFVLCLRSEGPLPSQGQPGEGPRGGNLDWPLVLLNYDDIGSTTEYEEVEVGHFFMEINKSNIISFINSVAKLRSEGD